MRRLSESLMDPDFCTNLSGYYPIHDYIPGLSTNIGIVLLLAGLLNIVMSLVTVFWIRRQRSLAQEETDNDEAVNSVIFPVFVRLLWLSVTVNIITGITVILVPLHRAGENTPATATVYAFVWAMQHGVLEGVAFLLMQKGCGQHAAMRARRWSFWWISIVFVLMFSSFYYGSITTDVIAAVRDSVLVLFYFTLCFAPEETIFRRPAALFYSKCWLIYRGFFLMLYIILAATRTEYLGSCGYILVSLFVFAVIQPVIMYVTLLRDSLWWQGVDISTSRSAGNNSTGRGSSRADGDIRGPLLGSEYSLQSAQALAGTVDDMRVRGNVTMLNFACIKLHSHQTLGAGSFSKVYKGTYRGRDCAIKLIYTVDITADTIKKVAAEASILSSIRNKNIVSILGVSVLPPSVCLILELCSFGSLSDIIRGYGFDWSASHRAPLNLSPSDVIYLALGCARGLAAVHAYDSSLCHRDVKSFNFLVDHQFNVKIADLELGFMTGQDGGLSAYDVAWRDPYADNPTEEPLLGSPDGGRGLSGRRRHDPDCVNVNELLANWLAPEVILDRKFQQASDVYALGTVLWEILSGLLPFDGEVPAVIRRKIVSGYTHPIPLQYCNTAIADVVLSCWTFDPLARPSSREVASTLEVMLKDQCYKHISNVDPIPDTTALRSFYDRHYRKSVYGDSQLHKYLFEDLHRPSLGQYLNPLNWMRYLYNIYAAPRYRGLSVDDSDEGSVDSSFSDSKADGASQGRSGLTKRLFPVTTDRHGDEGSDNGDADVSESGASLSRSSYVTSEELSSIGAKPMYAQLPRVALDVIGVVKEEAYWAALEKTGAAWAVTTIDAPYIVMHATSAWYRLFNISPASASSYHHMYSIMSLIGRESTVEGATGATLSSMNALNTTTYTSSNAYVGDWKEPTATAGSKKGNSTHQQATNALFTEMHEGYRTGNFKEVHGVLCFSLASKRSGPPEPAPEARGSFSLSFSSHSTLAAAAAPPQGHNLMCTLHVYPIFADQPAAEINRNRHSEALNAAVGGVATSPLSPSRLSLASLAVRVPTEGTSGTSMPPPGHTRVGGISASASSPSREPFISALTSSLASVNLGKPPLAPGGADPASEHGGGSPLRRSVTQTSHHHETPTMLRRTNTQVSHASFASSLRPTLRPDAPRPAYYAIQFHELTECRPDVVGDDGVIPPSSALAPRTHGAQPDGTAGGILNTLGIGRFFSSERKGQSGSADGAGRGSFSGSGSGGASQASSYDGRHNRTSRHSLS